LLNDTTGTGINLWQFAQSNVSELLQTGRYALLPDYDNDAKKAFIKPYVAESIRNWKVRPVNGIVQPWLITLAEEKVLDDDDIFCQDIEIQYRVLWLDNDDVYHQLVYNAEEELVSDTIILNAQGQPLNKIPLKFAGSVNNDWAVDKIPLYDMARLNLQHYRNSCDLEESIWINGQPYVHVDIGETNQADFDQANPNGIDYGSRKGLITQKGRVDLVQANPNQLVSQEMDRKLAQAAKIGARLIEPSTGRETAEAARIRYSSQFSVLYTISANDSWAIEEAIKEVCDFMGVSSDAVKFKLNDDFVEETADGNIMTAYTNWFDRGIVSADELREYGRKTGIIDEDKTDSEIENNVDLSSDPLLDSFIDEGSNTTPSTSVNAPSGDTSQGD
jgi:hypothetical protein